MGGRWRGGFGEVVDNLLAVVALVEGDVDPVGGAGMFPDELVEVEVVHHPGEPLAAGGEVGDVDVCCLAEEVLGVGDASDGSVEEGGAVAGGDADGDIEVQAEGLEDLLAEGAEVVDNLGVLWIVGTE